jgi:Arc/MetJ-type ribon-helix-helix transcriptional regulator
VSPLKQTAFRLTDEDFAILDEIQRRVGLVSRSDALRFALRYWSKGEEIDWNDLQPKAKTKAKRPTSKRK